MVIPVMIYDIYSLGRIHAVKVVGVVSAIFYYLVEYFLDRDKEYSTNIHR